MPPLFVNEGAYDSLIAGPARDQGVPVALVKAVIAHESRFDPRAYRAEPHLGDASYGLMQLLYATAKGPGLGYTGTPDGLFSPRINISLGVKYLAQQISRAGGIANGLSAYNGGYRPDIGFGLKTTRSVTICVERDAAGKCISTRVIPAGSYANQAYVDSVLRYYEHYKTLAVPVEPPEVTAARTSGTGGCLGILFVMAIPASLLFWKVLV